MIYLYKLSNLDGSEDSFKIDSELKMETIPFNGKKYRIYDKKVMPGLLDEVKTFYCKEIDVNSKEDKLNNMSDYKINYINTLVSFFNHNGYIITKNEINETKVTDAFLTIFQKDFVIVEKEYWGKHFSGRSMKIDAIIKPKDYSNILNKNIHFGIELKNPLSFTTNGRTVADRLAQCLDYSFSKFPGYDDLIILQCPILPALTKENEKKPNQLTGFVGRYNVGFVRFDEKNFHFTVGNQPIYFSYQGFVGPIKKSEYKQKWGNRGYKAKSNS